MVVQVGQDPSDVRQRGQVIERRTALEVHQDEGNVVGRSVRG